MQFQRILVAAILFIACSRIQPPTPISSIYIGLEPIGDRYHDITPSDTTDRWYRENTLTIRGDSIFLEKVPVVFYHNRPKAYSASDGGFYFYRGIIKDSSDVVTAHFLLTQHDYVMLPYRLKNPADSSLQISADEKFKRGLYTIDSSFFKKSYRIMKKDRILMMNNIEYELKQKK